MDITDVVSIRKFRELNATQKEELYGTLLNLAGAVQEIPKKNLRKTLDLSLAVLRYKGGQVTKLKERLDASAHGQSTDDSQEERLLHENDKLKRMLERLEAEKAQLKDKTKELADEVFQLQKRLQDSANSADGSDKDSSDPLSQLDKQEELLRTIYTKNKHIKRLLKEVESLQNNNIEQSKTIIDIEKELQRSRLAFIQLTADVERLNGEMVKQREELTVEIKRLEGNVTYLEDEREKNETDFRRLGEKWERKTLAWKTMLNKRDQDLRELRTRLEKQTMSAPSPPSRRPNGLPESSDDSERETTKLMHAIETRDKLIDQLESKIRVMATEMIATTDAMNKLTADLTTNERARDQQGQKARVCCKTTGESLKAAQARCLELSDLLERCEEDNALKAKQALEALNALEAHHPDKDGLVKALRKCSSLEQKIVSRDKQIKALITDLNSMNEIAYENGVLRKRLRIPDDAVISGKNLAAKNRNKDKIIDRLKLKLRSSEEIRLQLKMEKTDLRKDIIKLQSAVQKIHPQETTTISERSSSEVGEIMDAKGHNGLFCKQLSFTSYERNPLAGELEAKYEEVVTENETLRQGMEEILEKLREYNSYSDHITIDSAILNRLLQNFQVRHGEPVPPVRPLANHSVLSTVSIESDEIPSVATVRDGSDLRENDDSVLELPNFVDSSTRPTTPNKSIDRTFIPVIEDTAEIVETEPPEAVDPVDGTALTESERMRQLHQDLAEMKIYRLQYEEQQALMSTSEEELMQYCALLTAQVTQLKLELSKQSNSYGYMRVEFDRALTAAKQVELDYIQSVAALRREIIGHQRQAGELQANYNALKNSIVCQRDDYTALQLSNATLEARLANITEQLLAEQVVPQLQITDICADYGVIQDNLQLDYITVEEYALQVSNLRALVDKQDELRRHTIQVEGLLEIAHDQIKYQQKLLNDITDNHMNLRHLVADLQSTTEDKLVVAKMHRDLDSAKSELARLQEQRDELKHECEALKSSLNSEQRTAAETQKHFVTERKNKDIKIKFLLKTVHILKEKYCKFTPLIFLTNFVFAYTKFVKATSREKTANASQNQRQAIDEIVASKLLEHSKTTDDSENLVKFIRAETQHKMLEENFASLQVQYRSLQEEMTAQRVRYATESEHWQTIEALFKPDSVACAPQALLTSATSGVETRSIATNTDTPLPAQRKLSAGSQSTRRCSSNIVEVTDKNMSPFGSPLNRCKELREIGIQTIAENLFDPQEQSSSGWSERHTIEVEVQTNAQHMESQSVQTVETADYVTKEPLYDKPSSQLSHLEYLGQKYQEKELELNVAQERIEDLERRIEALLEKVQNTSPGCGEHQSSRQESGIIEKTIISFHTLLTEKDKSISEYKDLLQSEREQLRGATTRFNTDIEGLKSTVTNLNFNIKTKDMEILELKAQLEMVTLRRNSIEKLDLAAGATGTDDGGDNSLHELSDEKIEEMFQQDVPKVTSTYVSDLPKLVAVGNESDILEKQDTELLKEVPVLIRKLKEIKDKTNFWENTVKVKEEEIALLREKLSLYQEREKSMDSNSAPEIEQMRLLVEEKDKHINELIETLNSFHDDQQRYIDDSSNYSADKISKLAADLTRTEATNKIYQTQVDALRRQLTTLAQREKQAREVNQSLRSQLIKRPVVSIKTELNARVKSEHLQKRIHQLESELDDTRGQLQRQQVVLEAKRARSAAEVGLWEKQKRWQQNAEKFKARLDESECTLEKTRCLLQSARNSITRLEKDKQTLELKLGRVAHVGNVNHAHNAKCCRTSSCPNVQPTGGKYTPSESPETFTGVSSMSSSPVHNAATEAHHHPHQHHHQLHPHHHEELIEALKVRIELQQRKLLTLELEGKGSNSLTTEMEKLQEKFSAIEAQNIRLEAKNLQLQLDNDLMRQGDESDRLQKRIKHLEDYIIALKEEMAQTEARGQLCKCSSIRLSSHSGQAAEQTILKLRAIVEKLRAENKYLKDGRRFCESRSSAETSTNIGRLQQMYADSVDKISALQLELSIKSKCAKCGDRSKADMQIQDKLKLIKEQLEKKTQLLQKAKVLLTRAAAKEKVLKEQLTLWKRKCSELQNVPVIDEISE